LEPFVLQPPLPLEIGEANWRGEFEASRGGFSQRSAQSKGQIAAELRVVETAQFVLASSRTELEEMMGAAKQKVSKQ
jgi:hypothetical protein